tara:strand:+ start:3664 stop:5730 length:2067 start_codon:yes stop_codon:yes gene_type:complete
MILSIINFRKFINFYGVSEQRNIRLLSKHFLFFFGLFIRFILIFGVTPFIHKIWFLPFLKGSIFDINIDPWSTFLSNGGDDLSFPYGYIMYIFYKFITSIGYSIDTFLGINFIAKICFGLTSLFLDLGTLYGIAFIAKKYSIKALLLFYWCSPIVIYIIYWHGQLDILPIFLLIWCITLMHIEKPIWSGILLGLAISAKYSMFISLPFLVIYYLRNKRLNDQLYLNLIPLGIILSFNFLFYFGSQGFYKMVIQSPETNKLFFVNIQYGQDLRLFLLPTVFLVLLYIFWRLEKITLDLLFVSIGLGFFSFLILLPPSPGWFLWIIPFLTFYQIRSDGDYLFTAIPFYILYITFNLLYSSGAYINYFNLDLNSPIINYLPYNSSNLKSIIFTGLQASGLLVSLKMYQFGIWRNNYYSSLRGKLAVGMMGNNIQIIDNIVESFPKILVNEKVVSLNTENYRKWDSNHPMLKVVKKNDLLSFNLINYSKDFFNILNKRNIINENNSQANNSKFSNRDYINSNIVFVNGHYCLDIQRVRNKVPLKIFLNTYDNQEYIDLIKNESIKKNKNRIFHDLYFELIREDINEFNSRRNKFRQVNVEMANGFFHEKLVRNLIALSSLKVDLQQSKNLEKVSLSISGEISSDDLLLISKNMIVNSEDLIFYNSKWNDGIQGIIELIITIHIADLLHQRSI